MQFDTKLKHYNNGIYENVEKYKDELNSHIFYKDNAINYKYVEKQFCSCCGCVVIISLGFIFFHIYEDDFGSEILSCNCVIMQKAAG